MSIKCLIFGLYKIPYDYYMEKFEVEYQKYDTKPEETELRLFQALKILLNENDLYYEGSKDSEIISY